MIRYDERGHGLSDRGVTDHSEEQMRWIDDLQRMAVDAETAVLARSQRQVTDSSGRLLSRP